MGATPESVLLLDSPQSGKDGTDEGAGSGALFLQVGLVNGVLLRTEVDRATGQLRWVGCQWVAGQQVGRAVLGSAAMGASSPGCSTSLPHSPYIQYLSQTLPACPHPCSAPPCSDTRTRFLGTKAPKLFSAAVRGERAMLALSSRPWLGYSDQGKFNLVPMSYEPLDFASGGWVLQAAGCG